ncbi:MAG: insulinase family protein, partial [Planctomycetota bacterium]
AMADSPARMITAHLEGILNGRAIPPEEREASVERVTAEEVAEAARRVRLDTEYFLAEGEAE